MVKVPLLCNCFHFIYFIIIMFILLLWNIIKKKKFFSWSRVLSERVLHRTWNEFSQGAPAALWWWNARVTTQRHKDTDTSSWCSLLIYWVYWQKWSSENFSTSGQDRTTSLLFILLGGFPHHIPIILHHQSAIITQRQPAPLDARAVGVGGPHGFTGRVNDQVAVFLHDQPMGVCNATSVGCPHRTTTVHHKVPILLKQRRETSRSENRSRIDIFRKYFFFFK